MQRNLNSLWVLMVFVLVGLCACKPAADDPELQFDAAWVRAMPPGMKMTAGFGRLRNTGSTGIVLNAFSSPDFADVSLHRTELVDGVSKMRELRELLLAAGEQVELAPGGYHLMLMMPTDSLDSRQPVTIVMTASDGRSYSFEVPVERR